MGSFVKVNKDMKNSMERTIFDNYLMFFRIIYLLMYLSKKLPKKQSSAILSQSNLKLRAMKILRFIQKYLAAGKYNVVFTIHWFT